MGPTTGDTGAAPAAGVRKGVASASGGGAFWLRTSGSQAQDLRARFLAQPGLVHHPLRLDRVATSNNRARLASTLGLSGASSAAWPSGTRRRRDRPPAGARSPGRPECADPSAPAWPRARNRPPPARTGRARRRSGPARANRRRPAACPARPGTPARWRRSARSAAAPRRASARHADHCRTAAGRRRYRPAKRKALLSLRFGDHAQHQLARRAAACSRPRPFCRASACSCCCC